MAPAQEPYVEMHNYKEFLSRSMKILKMDINYSKLKIQIHIPL